MSPRDIAALILVGTFCLVIIGSVAAALCYPPGTVTEAFRVKIFELLVYMLGVVSGWLLGKTETK